jgi:hypothetical protein
LYLTRSAGQDREIVAVGEEFDLVSFQIQNTDCAGGGPAVRDEIDTLCFRVELWARHKDLEGTPDSSPELDTLFFATP